MPEITLRKNAFLSEPRIGEAEGKIIGYTLALDGSDGHIKTEIKIGCPIGRGGSAIAAGGDPTYCSVDYTGADYQQFTGRIVLFDSSVGYAPPNADPDDDGINFTAPLTAEDVIDQPLSVGIADITSASQSAMVEPYTSGWLGVSPLGSSVDPEAAAAALQGRAEAINNFVKRNAVKATFKLKSMTREFSTPYDIQVTDVKIPTGYDLEAT
jgi:hypothetical protein